MDSLNNLNQVNRTISSGALPPDQVQSFARRYQRRMLLEQVAMAVLAVSLFFAIV